ncbi:placenta growth factor isoform 2-T2 [Liasis olivaceus]
MALGQRERPAVSLPVAAASGGARRATCWKRLFTRRAGIVSDSQTQEALSESDTGDPGNAAPGVFRKPAVIQSLYQSSLIDPGGHAWKQLAAAMRLLCGFLVALALQMVGAQKKNMVLQNSATDTAVVSFHDVWNRSSCQPLEKLVSVVSEYPNEVEHVFSPSCVSLRRCCGCCGDEVLQCVPVEIANVTMQLMKINSEDQVPFVELSFIEHRKCACRPRQDALKSGRCAV